MTDTPEPTTPSSEPAGPPAFVPPGAVADPAAAPGAVSAAPASPATPNRTPIVVAGIALVAILAIGLAVYFSGDDGTDVTTSLPSTTIGGADVGSGDASSTTARPGATTVTVTGDALPDAGDATSPTDDPAVGKKIPTLSGPDVNGAAMTIKPGSPQLIVVMAHWCPHCQREIPKLAQWIDDGATKGVDVVGVSTATDAARGNYPPASWLEAAAWTAPTLQDDQQVTALTALGVSGFPTMIAVRADGTVAARMSGEADESQVKALVAAALGK